MNSSMEKRRDRELKELRSQIKQDLQREKYNNSKKIKERRKELSQQYKQEKAALVAELKRLEEESKILAQQDETELAEKMNSIKNEMENIVSQELYEKNAKIKELEDQIAIFTNEAPDTSSLKVRINEIKERFKQDISDAERTLEELKKNRESEEARVSTSLQEKKDQNREKEKSLEKQLEELKRQNQQDEEAFSRELEETAYKNIQNLQEQENELNNKIKQNQINESLEIQELEEEDRAYREKCQQEYAAKEQELRILKANVDELTGKEKAETQKRIQKLEKENQEEISLARTRRKRKLKIDKINSKRIKKNDHFARKKALEEEEALLKAEYAKIKEEKMKELRDAESKRWAEKDLKFAKKQIVFFKEDKVSEYSWLLPDGDAEMFMVNRIKKTIAMTSIFLIFLVVFYVLDTILLKKGISPVIYLFLLGGFAFACFKWEYFKLVSAFNQKKKKVYESFPLWVSTLQILVVTNNITNTFKKSIPTCPKAFRKDLEEFVKEIEYDPENKEIYKNFLKRYEIPEVQEIIMDMYAFNRMDKKEIIYQFKSVNERLNKITNNIREKRQESSLFAISAMNSIPILTASIYILVVSMMQSAL